ncbi:telomere-protecting terminal protein Tpg [Streptomyces griseoloalbus]|uniref:telomere-protecting terminal protein Tpg n=1 Tax=Streptomyces griseoloalbus TaxID=67303 RepID=UPI003F5416A6
MSDHEQQLAPRRGKVPEALARAERKVFTRPAPKSAKAQVKFLLTRAKGSTQALAERLGVSRRTVERYRAGKLTTPQKRLMAALVEETESEWKPQVRAHARQQAPTSSGMVVEVTAYFGFACTAAQTTAASVRSPRTSRPTTRSRSSNSRRPVRRRRTCIRSSRRPSRSRISRSGAPAFRPTGKYARSVKTSLPCQ